MPPLKLNGWQRLWVVVATLWALACVAVMVAMSGADFFGPFVWMRLRWTIIAWLLPSVLLYALGWLVGLAVRALRRG